MHPVQLRPMVPCQRRLTSACLQIIRSILTENQLETIRRYANQRGFDIVEVFEDSGRSGLKVDGREGLQRLMREVQAAAAKFPGILVYDVIVGGDFKTLMKVPTMSISAPEPAFEFTIAESSSIMTAV